MGSLNRQYWWQQLMVQLFLSPLLVIHPIIKDVLRWILYFMFVPRKLTFGSFLWFGCFGSFRYFWLFNFRSFCGLRFFRFFRLFNLRNFSGVWYFWFFSGFWFCMVIVVIDNSKTTLTNVNPNFNYSDITNAPK